MRKRLIEQPAQGVLDLGSVTVTTECPPCEHFARPALTGWLAERPLRPGWYDLRTAEPVKGHTERAWFNQDGGWWAPAPKGVLFFLGNHEELFADGYAQYRGLAEPPPRGYPPEDYPYSVEGAPPYRATLRGAP